MTATATENNDPTYFDTRAKYWEKRAGEMAREMMRAEDEGVRALLEQDVFAIRKKVAQERREWERAVLYQTILVIEDHEDDWNFLLADDLKALYLHRFGKPFHR